MAGFVWMMSGKRGRRERTGEGVRTPKRLRARQVVEQPARFLERATENNLAQSLARAEALLSDQEALNHAISLESSSGDSPPSDTVSEDEAAVWPGGGPRGMELLLESNLGLVASIARRYESPHLPLQDLMQEGTMGLLHAAVKYDVRRGTRFSTYATYWIHHYVQKFVYDHARLIRLPRSFQEKILVVKRAYKSMFDTYGRISSIAELSVETGFPESTIEEIILLSRTVQSLDDPIDPREARSDPAGTAADGLTWEGVSPEQFSSIESIREDVEQALSATLTQREQHVIRLKYGLGAETATNSSEIARRCSISAAAVRQTERRALNKLRTRSSALHTFLTDL